MPTRICSFCDKEKPLDCFSQNGKFLYSLCNTCKNLKTAMRRYNITIEQAIEVFETTKCDCCHCEFTDKNPRHIHHTIDGYKGVLCQKCNLIIGQETSEELYRIQSCLNFIKLQRKNLINRDNQQGSLSDPSTTARRPRSFVCKRCGRKLHKIEFRPHRKTCKHCEVCLESARQYGIAYNTAFELYSRDKCDCCQLPFNLVNKIAIHHIGNSVLGAVCDACNRRLGQETTQQVSHLQACESWIQNAMMVQSDLHGNMKS